MMSMLRWFRLSSIRAKIFMLMLLGVAGVAGISSFSKYSEVQKNKYMNVLRQSQAAETSIIQIMMLEEKFINALDTTELSGLAEYRKKLNSVLSEIRSFDVGAGIVDDATAMSQAEEEHARIFQYVAQGLRDIGKAKADLLTEIGSVNMHLKKILDAIELEEAMLFTQGEYLGNDKNGLRKELNDVLLLGSDRVMNVQDLLLHGDIAKYKETRQGIEKKWTLKKNNIKVILKTMELSDFQQTWGDSEGVIAKITQLEDTIFDQWNKNNELRLPLQLTASQVQEKSKKISEAANSIIESSNRAADRISLAVSLGGVFLLGGLGFLISRSINIPLRRSIDGLIEGADHVYAVSEELAAASRQLAEGASEQAASIEETSSSLEEMAAMTKQNAHNANQANHLMVSTKETVSQARHSMEELTTSMSEISRASEETCKIIKTIDEIAFQTNLLALNAAVEAARAGGAGAGFAVVADEVRNLAMRAAEAAKNTANLIEGNAKRVKGGSELVEKTDKEFREVAASVGKSGELVGEISAASQEQTQGIEQVNKAVSEMDKVVQQNATNAEESASASEEMNAQAHQMKKFVEELRSLVDGSSWNRSIKIVESARREIMLRKTAKSPSRAYAVHEKKGNGHARRGNGTDQNHYKTGQETRAKNVIPFDDADVSDF
jgi:methyl-accepting chemotaxis protein